MDRRKALKNMGMSLGYVVATPTLISIVQSCKSENVLEWTPDFFTKEQGSVLTHLVDIILPKTDTPSATEVQVNIFIDKFVNQTMYDNQGYLSYAEAMDIDKDDYGNLKGHNSDLLKSNMSNFIAKALKDSGKEDTIDLTPADLESVLAGILKIDKSQEEAYQDLFESYTIEYRNGGAPKLDNEASMYLFAETIRGLTIWGYKTSEYVGEEVLAYQSIPGEYIACGDLEELTGGKTWSL